MDSPSTDDEEVEDTSTSTDEETEQKHQRYVTLFNIYKYDAELALAFQIDCEQILDDFRNLDTFSFGAFSQLWKDREFTSIFERHEYAMMLETFVKNCFVIAKKFLFSSDIHVQVGAIYLLYALYYKQPINCWVKIRLTLTEAAKLLEIVEEQKTRKYYEIVYVYNKLRLDGAFVYVAMSLPLGTHEQFTKRYDLGANEIFSKAKVESSIDQFKKIVEEDSSLMELEKVDNEYQELMKKFSEKCPELGPSQSSTVLTSMKRTYDMLCGGCVEERANEDDQLPVENQVRDIKMKAMATKTATYRGSRDVISGVEYEEFVNKIDTSTE